MNFGILKDFERKYTEVSMGFCYSARECKTQTYLKNDKIEFKHLKTNIEPMFGHMSVQQTPIPQLTYNIFFSFFGDFQKNWEFSIFAAFPTKIHQGIVEVQLQCSGAQQSEIFKDRKNALKHLRYTLETIFVLMALL